SLDHRDLHSFPTRRSSDLLFNIATNEWDEELLSILGVPRALLPQVKDCADDFGTTDKKLLGEAIPILGVAGDQQAATIGQACFKDRKSTRLNSSHVKISYA